MEGRKRGAPRGNTNALKYGFYSRKLRRVEKADLDKSDTSNSLHDEILMLRVMIRRVWELASKDPDNLGLNIAALNALGQGVAQKSRLQWIQAQINDEDEADIDREIAEAIRRANEEYNGRQ